jgi:hypothetical protein
MLPWAPFLLLLVPKPGKPGPANPTIARFCQAALLFPLLFFSLSQAKADYYLLVAAPALALWLAIETVPRLNGGDRRLALCWGASAAIAVLLLVAAPTAATRDWTLASGALLALACVAFATAGARFFRQLRSLRARELAMLGVALLAAPTLALVCRAVDGRGTRDSSWYVARIIQERARPGASVFIYRDFEDRFSTLPFYLGRPVPIVESTSRDLQFGCRAAPGSYCISAAEFLRLHLDRPLAVVLQARRADEFLALTANKRWRVESAGDKMVFFDPE